MKTLITGANKGIGFALAQTLGRHGYDILLGARSETRGQAAVEKLQAEGINAQFVKVDLNDLAQLSSLAQLRDIDLLINNAGIAGNIKSDAGDFDMEKSPFAYTTADLQETMNTNFLGTHAVISQLLPHSLTENAVIVNITVPVSQEYWAPLAYVTSKAAQNAMMFAFGHQFSKEKSAKQIFGVMPGAVATDLNGAKVGDNPVIKSPEETAELISHFIFDNKNHNAEIINFDGTIYKSYEPGLRSKIIKDVAKNGLKRKLGRK